MSEHVDQSATTDAGRAVVRDEAGEVKQEVKGPDPDQWAWRDELAASEPAEEPVLELHEVRQVDLSEKPLEELKDLARAQDVSGRSSMSRDALAEALAETPAAEIKGPGTQWETDEDGGYVNRD